MNTRKLAVLFVILVLFYVFFQVTIRALNHGHFVDYTLKDKATKEKFQIEETRTTRVKGEKDNYYFEIHTKNTTFNFEDTSDFEKRNYVIKDIKYFKDDTYELSIISYILVLLLKKKQSSMIFFVKMEAFNMNMRI